MTRYVEAFSWGGSVDLFLAVYVTERPVLHVCSGRSAWGDTTVDLYEPADVRATWTDLPFPDDSYRAVFADPPWNSGYKGDVAAFMREAMRIAPVAYLMAPWLYGGALAPLSRVWVRQMPGVHAPVLLTRYERPASQPYLHTVMTS
jgi:hypothetical protein